jgi:hypothetical protein
LKIDTQSHQPCRHYGSARALLRIATPSFHSRKLAVRRPRQSFARAFKTKPSSSTATIPPEPNIANPILPLSRILFHTFDAILASPSRRCQQERSQRTTSRTHWRQYSRHHRRLGRLRTPSTRSRPSHQCCTTQDWRRCHPYAPAWNEVPPLHTHLSKHRCLHFRKRVAYGKGKG